MLLSVQSVEGLGYEFWVDAFHFPAIIVLFSGGKGLSAARWEYKIKRQGIKEVSFENASPTIPTNHNAKNQGSGNICSGLRVITLQKIT